MGKTFLFAKEIAYDILGLKISLATAILLSLIIPFLIKPVNGLYDIEELKSLRAYCFLHADRAAQGENVVNDLIKSGLANSKYYDWSCSKISEEIEAESLKGLSFTYHCYYDNLTPSQRSECDDAGKTRFGMANICLFEEDRTVQDPSIVQPLTSAERLECENSGYEPEQREDKGSK